MATQIIPTDPDSPFVEQETTLDGVRYALEFRYVQRENTWRLSIALPSGEDLASGIKIVCGYDLLKYRVDERLPKGLLAAYSQTDDGSPPGLGELGEGRRVVLVYVPFADLAALEAS